MSYNAVVSDPIVRRYDGREYITVEIVETDVGPTDAFELAVPKHGTVTLYESDLTLDPGGPTTIDPDGSTTTPFGSDIGGLPLRNQTASANIRNGGFKCFTAPDNVLRFRSKPEGGSGVASMVRTRVTYLQGHHLR